MKCLSPLLALLAIALPGAAHAMGGGRLKVEEPREIRFALTGAENAPAIKRALISVVCYKNANLWEWGNNGGKNYAPCKGFTVNGELQPWETAAIALQPVGPNAFRLDPVEIAFSGKSNGTLALRIQVELENGYQVDLPYGEYSVLSFSSQVPYPERYPNAYILNNLRALTDFDALTTQPIPVPVKVRPEPARGATGPRSGENAGANDTEAGVPWMPTGNPSGKPAPAASPCAAPLHSEEGESDRSGGEPTPSPELP